MYKRIVNLGLFLLLLFVGGVSVQAQELVLEDFHYDMGDITARANPHVDRNGDKCALIKISTGIPNVKIQGDLGGAEVEYDAGAIYIWVPGGARSVKFIHPQFPQLEFEFPVEIKALNVYKATLKGIYPPGETRMVFNINPSEAKVVIDGKEVDNNDGVVSEVVTAGSHSYMITCDDYETQQGTVSINEGSVEMRNINLKALFGYMKIFTLPEDSMSISIEGIPVGLSQWPTTDEEKKLARRKPGTYNVHIEKEFFFPLDTTITVHSGGQTTEVQYTLISTIKPKEQRRTFILASAGLAKGQTSYGAMVGMGTANGGYIHFLSDFGSSSTIADCDDTNYLSDGSYPYYTGKTKKARLSITAGYLRRIISPLYAYVGGGFGQRTLAWEMSNGEYAKNTDHSASGIAAEIGLIGKIGPVAISAGYQTVGFKYHEVNVGLGVIF
ncbi:MAG: PEGA domain-containing protein [Bacteroidaceae bacterium]|nr:PEGA domain-containing protein [Bacteroidaceae bacterium]